MGFMSLIGLMGGMGRMKILRLDSGSIDVGVWRAVPLFEGIKT